MPNLIYFDNAASAPMLPEALEAVTAHLCEHFANPSSIHAPGMAARRELEKSRGQVAALVNADAAEIVFTSGATEANNLAIRGVLEPSFRKGLKPHAVTTALEHASTLRTFEDLRRRGLELTVVAPGSDGVIRADDVLKAARPETSLVSVMSVNNELGTIQPVAAVAAGLRKLKPRPLFHVDAVQGVVATPLDFKTSGADLVSLSAHKIGGPKGVGALVVRRGTALHPMTTGGGHENNLRPGTENAAGIAGFGAAAGRLLREREDDRRRYERLSGRLRTLLAETGAAGPLMPAGTMQAPHIVAVECPGAEADWIVLLLSRAGVMVSAGSACKSGSREASSALRAMGLPDARAKSVIRVSFGPQNTEAEVDVFVKTLGEALRKRV